MWQPLPSSSGTVRCECGPLSQAASRAVAVSELTPRPREENGLFLALCPEAPHISQGLPQPLAAPGAGAGRAVCSWSGRWDQGLGGKADAALTWPLRLALPHPHTHFPGGKTEARAECGSVAQAVVAGEWRATTPHGHGQRSCPGEAHRVAHPLPLASTHASPGAPSCPCFLRQVRERNANRQLMIFCGPWGAERPQDPRAQRRRTLCVWGPGWGARGACR